MNPLDVGILILLTIFITIMILIVQRSEAKRRLFVVLIMLVVGEMIRRYVFFRSETALIPPFTDLLLRIYPQYPLHHSIHREAWIALGLALFLNGSYWVLIGRYNPVGSSDEIQVIGMDD